MRASCTASARSVEVLRLTQPLILQVSDVIGQPFQHLVDVLERRAQFGSERLFLLNPLPDRLHQQRRQAEDRRDRPGRRAGRHCKQQPQHRVPGHRGGGRYRTPKGERAVGGHIGNVQHAETQVERHRHQSIDAAQLQRAFDDRKRKHTIDLS